MSLFGRRMSLKVSDGDSAVVDLSKMSVKFTVDRFMGSTLNEARIDVWNLSSETIGRINTELREIQLSAGYEGSQRFGQIFQGDITNVVTSKVEAETVTSIFARDGDIDYRNSNVSLSFPPGSSLSDVLRGLDESFSKLTVDRIERFKDQRSSGPQIFAGATREALNQIFDSYSGYSWTIDDGKLIILRDGESDGLAPVDINSESGMIGTPTVGLNSLEVTTLLNPAVRPTGTVRVNSAGPQIDLGVTELSVIKDLVSNIPGLDGKTAFRSPRVTHDGETRGTPWYTYVTVLTELDLRS